MKGNVLCVMHAKAGQGWKRHSLAEEISPFSHPMDLREIVEQAEKQLEGERELVDLLLIFAASEQSPSPE